MEDLRTAAFRNICKGILAVRQLGSTNRYSLTWFFLMAAIALLALALVFRLIYTAGHPFPPRAKALTVLLSLRPIIRVASIAGIFLLINLILATWFAPGHGVPVWRYFGNELDHLPLLFLLVIFFVSNAGEMWGLDKKRRLY